MQGNYFGKAPFLISPLTALQTKYPSATYFAGTAINSTDTSGFAAAVAAAQNAEYIIYCGGIDTTIEAESLDRTSIIWPGNQLQLIGELAALGKKLVIVEFGGGQLDDSALLSNAKVNSLLWAGYPGQSGGNPMTDILDGTRAPAGRLPITQYPAAYISNVSLFNRSLRPSSTNPGRTYMWYPNPVVPFGFGLHYTIFSFAWGVKQASVYSISTLVSSALPIIETTPLITVTATVTNTGGVKSDYVGLLFIATRMPDPVLIQSKPLSLTTVYSTLQPKVQQLFPFH